MLGKLLGGAISKIVGEGAGTAVVEYFGKKQELKQQLALAKIEAKIRVLEAHTQYKLKDLEYDNQWELEQIRNSGWKDEYTLILLSIPLILVFIPPAQPYVLEGFKVLEQCPTWYQLLVASIIAATHGIRWWRRPPGACCLPPFTTLSRGWYPATFDRICCQE